MIEQGLVVFSGISTKVIAKVAPQLRAMAIHSAFVKYTPQDIPGYLSDLAERTLAIARGALVDRDVRLSGILASCLEDEAELEAERTVFFPAMRRLSLSRSFRNDINAANALVAEVGGVLKSASNTDFVKSVSPRAEARLLLPLGNARVAALAHNFEEIYDRKSDGIGRAVMKRVVLRRGTKRYRANDLDFLPVTNGERHPIRRCSDSALCDLNATLRFGVSVSPRFEFDVTCENGLSGKTFQQCDNTAMQVGREATHLNMRMNGDFRAG